MNDRPPKEAAARTAATIPASQGGPQAAPVRRAPVLIVEVPFEGRARLIVVSDTDQDEARLRQWSSRPHYLDDLVAGWALLPAATGAAA